VTGVADTGNKFMTDVADTDDKFMAGVSDTGHKSLDTNIKENAHKISIMLQAKNQGPRETDS